MMTGERHLSSKVSTYLSGSSDLPVIVENLQQQCLITQLIVRDWELEVLVEEWVSLVPVDWGLSDPRVHLRHKGYADIGVIEAARLVAR